MTHSTMLDGCRMETTFTAGETLGSCIPVYFKGDGCVYKATADKHETARVIGITRASVQDVSGGITIKSIIDEGEKVDVVTYGHFPDRIPCVVTNSKHNAFYLGLEGAVVTINGIRAQGNNSTFIMAELGVRFDADTMWIDIQRPTREWKK